jgi:hypothetical protein
MNAEASSKAGMTRLKRTTANRPFKKQQPTSVGSDYDWIFKEI